MRFWRPSLHELTPVPWPTRVALADAATRLAREADGLRGQRSAGLPDDGALVWGQQSRARDFIELLHRFLTLDEASIEQHPPSWADAAFSARSSGVAMDGYPAEAAFLAPGEPGPGLVVRIARRHPPLGELDLHLIQLISFQLLPCLWPGRLFLLTDLPWRQAEVLAEVAAGSGEAEICRSLEITRHTLRTHLRHLHRRFGVQTRAELLNLGAVRHVFSTPLTSAQAPALPALTAREREVATLLVAGSSEKEVAERMGISPHTVHGFVKSVHRKLGVRSRAELIQAVQLAEPSR